MPAGPVKSVHGTFAIPSLDGVRAVAVMIVFVGHGTFVGNWWRGNLGVTIFFFLSGYLITTFLRREHERTGRISLGKFYLRRTLRGTPPAVRSAVYRRRELRHQMNPPATSAITPPHWISTFGPCGLRALTTASANAATTTTRQATSSKLMRGVVG